MKRSFFVDAWFIIAALDRSDSHHLAARRVAARLASADLVTHDGVFMEVLAYFSEDGPHSRGRAVDAVRNARLSWTVFPADRALFDAALSRYDRRSDKQYSLADCMSMVLMESLGITHVLTNDHHFSQEGFSVVSE